jgi:hypothetical protein
MIEQSQKQTANPKQPASTTEPRFSAIVQKCKTNSTIQKSSETHTKNQTVTHPHIKSAKSETVG